jgi:hypothetical protein
MRHVPCHMPIKQNRPHPEDADGPKLSGWRDDYL